MATKETMLERLKGECVKIGDSDELKKIEELEFDKKDIPEIKRRIVMTNYEWIKRMSMDEMAEFLDANGSCGVCSRRIDGDCSTVMSCRPHIKEWLDREVDEPSKETGTGNAFVTLVQDQNAEIDRLRKLLEEAEEK